MPPMDLPIPQPEGVPETLLPGSMGREHQRCSTSDAQVSGAGHSRGWSCGFPRSSSLGSLQALPAWHPGEAVARYDWPLPATSVLALCGR